MEAFKPPTSEACNAAIQTLMSSVEEQNNGTLHCTKTDTSELAKLSLEQLIGIADAFDSAALALKEQISAQAAVVRKHANERLPIYQLPDEILAEIFLKVLANSKIRTPKLRALASVASRWWAIVKTTPSLWAIVDAADPSFRLALIKSRHSKLSIRIERVRYQDQDQGPEPEPDFLKLINRERGRWSSLTLSSSEVGSMLACLDSTIPELEHLEFLLSSADPTIISLPFLPKLKILTTDHVSPQWELSSSLPSLKELSVSSPTWSGWTFNLQDFLLACPLLEKLVISTYEVHTTTGQPSFAISNYNSVVRLVKLRSIVLCWPSPALSLFFLNNIHTPVLSTLRITVCTAPLHSFPTALACLKNNLSPLRTALRVSGTKTLIATESGIRSGGSKPSNVELRWIGGEGDPSVWAECFNCLGLPPVHAEITSRTRTGNAGLADAALLSRIPSLSRITFRGLVPLELLNSLSHPMAEEHGWLCPTVTEIIATLAGDPQPERTIEAIKAVIASRAKVASEGDEVGSSAGFGERPQEIRFLDRKGETLLLEPPKKRAPEYFSPSYPGSAYQLTSPVFSPTSPSPYYPGSPFGAYSPTLPYGKYPSTMFRPYTAPTGPLGNEESSG